MLHAAETALAQEDHPDLDEFWADLTRRTARNRDRTRRVAATPDRRHDDCHVGDPKVQEQFRRLGDDPKKDAAMYADAVNAAIRDVPDDMTVAIHTCRGNFRAPGSRAARTPISSPSGVHRPRRRRLLPRVRHRARRRLRAAALRAKGKTVVLGLVSSKVPELEKKDELKRRIDAAAKFVPLDSCASRRSAGLEHHHGNKLTPTISGESSARAGSVEKCVG